MVLIDEKDLPRKKACAETISKAFLQSTPIDIPRKFFNKELKGLKFYHDDLEFKRKEDIWWESYTIDRKNFDPFLLKKARECGVQYLPKTKFVDLRHDKNFVTDKIIAIDMKKEENIKIKPEILIAADGVESDVMSSIGKIDEKNNLLGRIKSFEFQDLSLNNPNFGHIYFDEFADGAYAYIFPKSDDSANIGVATLDDDDIDEKFNSFLNKIDGQVQGAERTIDRSGKAPMKYPSKKISYGNILFTGDAANQNIKPYVEGILPGIICGSIAGKVVGDNIDDREKIGKCYNDRIKEYMGEFFEESDFILSELTSAYESKDSKRFLLEFGLFSYILDEDNIQDLHQKRDVEEAKEFLKKEMNSNS